MPKGTFSLRLGPARPPYRENSEYQHGQNTAAEKQTNARRDQDATPTKANDAHKCDNAANKAYKAEDYHNRSKDSLLGGHEYP